MNTLKLLQYRWIALTIWILIIITASYGILNIALKTDYREYFSKTDPNYIKNQAITSTYTTGDSALFLIAPKSGTVLVPEVLQQVHEMTEDGWLLPHSSRVDSLTNFQHIFVDGDELIVANLVEEPNDIRGKNTLKLRDIISSDTDIQGRLLAWDEKVAGVFITFRLPGESISETLDIAKAVDELAKKYLNKYPDVEIYQTGMILGSNASVDILKKDSSTLIPLMIIAIILLLTYMFRSAWATFATIVIIVVSILIMMGMWGWLEAALSGPNASAPIIILTIAVADCVHILVSFFQAYNSGKSKREAIDLSIQLNLVPVIVTSVTTSIGFLSLNFSSVIPFQILGNAVAFGVAVACIASLTLLPLLIDILPIKRRHSIHGESGIITPYARHIIHNKKIYFLFSVILSLGLGAQISKNEINDQFAKYFSKDTSFRQGTDFADKHLSSLYDISVSLNSPYEEGVNHPEYLKKVEEFQSWLEKHPAVIQTQTISTTFKSLNKAMHQNNNDWYVLPENSDLASQYFLLYELSLPYGLDSTQQVSFDKKESRIIITLSEQKTTQMLQIEKDIEIWLDNNAPEYDYYLSSIMLMFSHLGVNNAKSMLQGTAIALIIMSLVIGIALRSFRFGVISLFTNIIPPVLAFGIWGIFSGEIGLSVAIAIGMTLGIVVDNTVHLLSKYQLAERKNQLGDDAMEYAFSHVGVALLICNIVLIVGFMILAQSDFSLNSDMGYFTSLTFIFAIVIDFLILPYLLSIGLKKPQSI